MPTTEDVRTAGDSTRDIVNNAFEQLRTPLLAALGAGEVTAQAVVDAMTKARDDLYDRAQSARSITDDLPKDFGELREKLDPAELRKLIDDYSRAAMDLYNYLVEHGEKALDKVRSQPQVKRALEQVEDAVQTAQHRLEDVAGDARNLADEVLGIVTKRTRSAGERAARASQQLAEQTAEAVTEVGEDVAYQARSTSRQVANRTDPKRHGHTSKESGSKGKSQNTDKGGSEK